MLEEFVPKKFNAKHQALIDTADSIMASMRAKGYDLSLRQLYYQFVAHHGLPNTEQSYNMLGVVISDARLAGLLDWEMIIDRGRSTIENPHWDSPADIVDAAAHSFRIDLWETQPKHVEVMVEKQALEGVLVPVCRSLDVPFNSNKGYSSSSALYGVGKRLETKLEEGKDVVIIYLGDHDPSGIDMSRDVEDRLKLFSGAGYWNDQDKSVFGYADMEGRFEVVRLALNMPQIRQYEPPPNPAKLTDSRAAGYIERFGMQSWELDALDPDVLAALVRAEINSHISLPHWEEANERMQGLKGELTTMAAAYRTKQEGQS